MNFDILNNKPIEFFNENGDMVGQIFISGSTGDLYVRASGSNGDIILGNENTVGDVEIGLPSAASNLKLMGGGTISANGNTLTLGDSNIGDTVVINAASFSGSMSGSFEGNGSGLTGLTTTPFPFTGDAQITGSLTVSGSFNINGSSRTLFTSCSMVYSGSNVTQVTQSFGSTQQITNIIYSGSFADGNPLSIAVTGSDGINKLYTLTYSASLVTQIIQS